MTAGPARHLSAVVLTGGLGTRLRPVSYSVPKQLIPIAGKPVLYHVLDLLPDDVEEVVLAAGYKGAQIAEYLRHRPYRLPTRVVIEDEQNLLGTGGGLRNASTGLSDPFLFLYADTIASVPLDRLLERHAERRGLGVLSLYEVADTRPYGVAALAAEDRITTFIEKPEPADAPSHWINAGFSVWRREVIDRIPGGRPVSFEREIVPGLLDRGVYGLRFSGYFVDAGTLVGVLRAQRALFDAGRAAALGRPRGADGSGPVSTMEEAEAAGASIGPYVTLGPGSRVGAGAHVTDSVVMDGAVIEPGARVRGCLIGPGRTVGAGTVLENAILADAPAGAPA